MTHFLFNLIISFFTFSRSLLVRLKIIKSAPASAKAIADALPMPLPAPVTYAFFFFTSYFCK